MGASGVKVFNGVRYFRTRIGLNKRDANSAAKLARSRGYKARIIKADKGYDLYLKA